MLLWSLVFAVAGVIAMVSNVGGIAVVLLAIAGGLLLAYFLMLGLTLMTVVGSGRRKRAKSATVGSGLGLSPSRAGSLSGRLRSSSDTTKHRS